MAHEKSKVLAAHVPFPLAGKLINSPRDLIVREIGSSNKR
jgi:hypothetical protein